MESKKSVAITSDDGWYHFCKNCDTEVYKGDKFCHECGSELVWRVKGKHGWISVKDRLPEKDDMYLVAVVSFNNASELSMDIGLYDTDDKEWNLDWCTLDYIVTHWMPLPSLPEE